MSKDAQHLLVVDDDPDILTAARLMLKRHFAGITLCAQPTEIPTRMEKQRFDVILLDMNFGPGESSGADGYQWLERILELDPQAVVVMITAHGDVNVAVEAMKRGATDFVSKPWQHHKMVATIHAAKTLSASRRQLEQVKQSHQGLATASASHSESPLLGQSSGLKHVLSLVDRAAPTDANVLILGENGTGKELIARELHRKSQRSEQAFLSVDMGALSESLFESELFGYRKGAFTGANSDRVGRILAANGGTLFLDEIGNLPLSLQAKLLTVLEQRKVTPLGDHKAQDFDVRIIAATNVPIAKLNDESLFRQDLLFRLNTVELTLPPLRERKDDILPIATHYLSYYARKYSKSIDALSDEAQTALINYAWPGNIRALRHAIERAVILATGKALTTSDFQLAPVPASSPLSSDALTHSSLSTGPQPTGVPPNNPDVSNSNNQDADDLNLDRREKDTIAQALRLHKYNISHAAKALGLTRAALYRRMEKHGL